MPFTVVVVLHDSAAELALAAALDRRAARGAARSSSRSTRARDDGGAAHAAAWGAEVLERRDNPGFGAACNAGLERAATTSRVLLNPDCELLDGSLAALAALARRAPARAARAAAAERRRQRAALGAPAPGHRRRAARRAASHPPLLPRALRERLEP